MTNSWQSERIGFLLLSEVKVIESKYIAGVTIPEFDSEVSEIVEECGLEGGGKDLEIAIENLEGKIYRVLTTTGMGAFMHLTQGLLGLGFEDNLADDFSGKNRYDCWFIPTPELLALQTAKVMPEPEVNAATDILDELENLGDLPETERRSVILSRVGQGKFRDQVIAYWRRCAVTEADCVSLLKASHIKPWRNASNQERLDPFNGLLLSPNVDAAFDAGYITFDCNGKIVLSREIAGATAYQLHINGKLRINSKQLTRKHQEYLEYHRANVFRG